MGKLHRRNGVIQVDAAMFCWLANKCEMNRVTFTVSITDCIRECSSPERVGALLAGVLKS